MKLWNLLYLIAAIDLFAVGMLTTQMQGHLRSMGASHILLGVIGSMYSFVQFFSGPLMGRWSDRVGRKHALLTCIVASGVGYALLGQASAIWLYACIRLYLGFFKNTLTTTKSYLASETIPMSQTEVFGKYNAYSQLAFIVSGPLSGHLMELPSGFAWISALTCCFFMANAALVHFAIKPDVNVQHNSTGSTDSTGNGHARAKKINDDEGFSWSQCLHLFKAVEWHSLWDVFLARFLLGISGLIYRDCIGLIMRDVYSFTPRYIGYITSYAAFVGMTSGFFVKWASRLAGGSDVALLRYGSVVQCVALLGMYASTHIVPLLLCLLLLASVSAVSKAAALGLTMRRGGKENAGLLVGLSASVLSVSRLVAPLASGILMHCLGVSSPLLACLVLTAAPLILLTSDAPQSKVKVY